MNMVKAVRNYFMLFAFLSMLLLTACGGGGGDGTSANPTSSHGNDSGINNALVGEWFIDSDEGKIVYPNKRNKVDYIGLKPDGRCLMISYYTTDYSTYEQTKEEIELEITASWSFSGGKLYLSIPGSNKIFFYASIQNNSLYLKDEDNLISIFSKRDQDYNDYYFSSVNTVFSGTWYLHSLSDRPIYANNQGKIDTLTLDPNGKCISIAYCSSIYDNYVQTLDNVEENISGYWSYNKGKLFLNDTSDGSVYITSAKIENDKLILRRENGLTLVYKK
jgi:hypothetical protein